MYSRGVGCDVDEGRALSLLKQLVSAALRHPTLLRARSQAAPAQAAVCVVKGEESFQEAKRQQERIQELSRPEAANLALMYCAGVEVPINHTKAVEAFLQAVWAPAYPVTLPQKHWARRATQRASRMLPPLPS